MRCVSQLRRALGIANRRGYAAICGIWALKRVSAQFVGGGLNRDRASDRQRVYIHLMGRTNHETTSERAERLLANCTRFQLPPDAWAQLLATIDREARPNRKLARLFSPPSAAERIDRAATTADVDQAAIAEPRGA